jgi:hypothetical protein
MVDRTNGRLMIVPARRPGYPGLIHSQVHPIHLLHLYIMLSAISSYIAPYFQEEIVAMPDEMLIMLGTHDNYIHSALFNPITKSIRPGRSTRTDPHPSWLTRHPSVSICEMIKLLMIRRIPDLVYSNTWAEGKISILRLKGLAGGFKVIDEFETSGKGLNFMAVLPNCSAIIGAHVGPSPSGRNAADDSTVLEVRFMSPSLQMGISSAIHTYSPLPPTSANGHSHSNIHAKMHLMHIR